MEDINSNSPSTQVTQPTMPADPGETAIDELIGASQWQDQFEQILPWIQENLLTWNISIQFALLIGSLIPAIIFGPALRKLINNRLAPMMPPGLLRRATNASAEVATPIALFLTLNIFAIIMRMVQQSTQIVEAGIALLTAWIIIRLISLVIRSRFWSNVAFYIIWPIAALDALGLLDNVMAQLDAMAFTLDTNEEGETQRISVLDILRTFIILGIFLWGASLINHFIRGRLASVDDLTPSLRALITKIMDIVLPVVALLIGLQVVGFNVATLTIFSGAVGLGIGLGLQKTISNFLAGFTLVVDKSIKPSDVVEVEGSYGWITSMGARYVTVQTRDGISILVPNDRFIENGVVNWSHNNRQVRIKAYFGISYGTKNLREVKAALEALALTIDRILKIPKPQCQLIEFGDNSINFRLTFWINDPANGVTNVKSELMFAIWDKLVEMGVEIPFPQRDLHIKTVPDHWHMGDQQTLKSEKRPHPKPQPKQIETN